MQTTRLGSTGLTVSRLALGMMTYGTPQWRPWVLDEAASRPLVQRAVELGFNFFDSADMYSAGESEVLTGKFVREFCRRDEVVIATKLFYPVDMAFGVGKDFVPRPNTSGLSRKRVFDAVDASLKRLGTEHIDLYQIHRWDYATPIEETMRALHDVVRAGKVRYLGASSMWAWQFAKAQEIARREHLTPFVAMQNHYNLAYREEEREMNPLCRDQGIALIPWSPLARGFLAGNRAASDGQRGSGGRRDPASGGASLRDSADGGAASRGGSEGRATVRDGLEGRATVRDGLEGRATVRDGLEGRATVRAATDDIAQKLYYRDNDFRIVEALTVLAGRRELAPATLAYAWLLHKPGVSAPIIGASKPGQLEAAVAALDVQLSPDDIAALEAPYEPHPVLGHQ